MHEYLNLFQVAFCLSDTRSFKPFLELIFPAFFLFRCMDGSSKPRYTHSKHRRSAHRQIMYTKSHLFERTVFLLLVVGFSTIVPAVAASANPVGGTTVPLLAPVVGSQKKDAPTHVDDPVPGGRPATLNLVQHVSDPVQ